jgi:hypothetical protein
LVRSIGKWITTVVSAQESSTQVEVAFIDALEAEGLWEAADDRATDALVAALASGDHDAVDTAIGDGQRPLQLAISDNGPQMRSHSTREFLAGVAIAQQFGRPGVPGPGMDRDPATSRASGRTWRRSPTPESSTPNSTLPEPNTTRSGCTPPCNT